jgi:hypothetical protein
MGRSYRSRESGPKRRKHNLYLEPDQPSHVKGALCSLLQAAERIDGITRDLIRIGLEVGRRNGIGERFRQEAGEG